MDQKRPLTYQPAQMPPPPPRSSGSSSSASTAQPSVLPSSPENGRVQKAKIGESSSSKGRINRTSVYKGVTRHKWSGRYEAHLWDKTCWNPTQRRMGRQVYLGVFDDEEDAAHAHDLAAIRLIGKDALLNFPIRTYVELMEVIQRLTRDEFLSWIKRGRCFTRGTSKYRGVSRNSRDSCWEARIGGLNDRKYLYLGVYDTEEKAAQAYDLAALQYKGVLNAVTNFHPCHYLDHPALPSVPMPGHQHPQQHAAAEHHVQPPPPPPLQPPQQPGADRPQQYSGPSPLIFHIPRTTGLAKPVPPPPATAGEHRDPLGQPFEKIHREAAALLDMMAGGIYITDVPPSGLCLDPTGFDPFPAPNMAIEPDDDPLIWGTSMTQRNPGGAGDKAAGM